MTLFVFPCRIEFAVISPREDPDFSYCCMPIRCHSDFSGVSRSTAPAPPSVPVRN